MGKFCIRIKLSKTEPYTYHNPNGQHVNPSEGVIESDASSVTYPLTYIVLTSSTVTIPNNGYESLKCEARSVVNVLWPKNRIVQQTTTSITITGPYSGGLTPLKHVYM